MAVTNGTIFMSPVVLKGAEKEEKREEEREEEREVERERVIRRFILQQYSNQSLHHLAPLAIGKHIFKLVFLQVLLKSE
jgi:hypothetical protein